MLSDPERTAWENNSNRDFHVPVQQALSREELIRVTSSSLLAFSSVSATALSESWNIALPADQGSCKTHSQTAYEMAYTAAFPSSPDIGFLAVVSEMLAECSVCVLSALPSLIDDNVCRCCLRKPGTSGSPSS